jgi:anti-anti-sigma factor
LYGLCDRSAPFAALRPGGSLPDVVAERSAQRIVQTLDRDDGVRVVKVSGVVDVFNANALSRDAVAGLPNEAREIVLDLEAVSFLDSAGISAIVKLVRQFRTQSIEMRASLGHDSPLSPTVVELLRQVVPCDNPDA